MSYIVTKYPHGTFSWADVSSTNIEATKKFMKELMGWDSVDMPAGDGTNYTMFYLDGKTVAGGSPKQKGMEKTPSYWSSYVTVDDIDATAKKQLTWEEHCYSLRWMSWTPAAWPASKIRLMPWL